MESGQRVRLPKSGSPQDADITEDGATLRAVEVDNIANESYEAFVMYVNPIIGFGTPLNPLIYDPARKRALLMNPSTNSVPIMVGKLAQVQVGIGFQLAPGQQIEIKTRQAVFAAAASGGSSVPMSVWVERGPGDSRID